MKPITPQLAESLVIRKARLAFSLVSFRTLSLSKDLIVLWVWLAHYLLLRVVQFEHFGLLGCFRGRL